MNIDKLASFNKRVEDNDSRLRQELEKIRERARNTHESTFSDITKGKIGTDDMVMETIVLRTGRPVLAVKNNVAELNFDDAESEVWRQRLINAKDLLETAILAVGRIEIQNDPRYEWLGTGWLVDKGLVITNRHVASIFAKNSDAGFVFRQNGFGQNIGASIDFLEELDNHNELVFKIVSILHIEDEKGADMALLQVEAIAGQTLPRFISLFDTFHVDGLQVATIGYPARDSRIPEQELMDRIFGNVYNKKRLAPGLVNGITDNILFHDCSTLGGNSGSVVVDLNSGKAVALHFAGRFLQSNYAVPALTINKIIENVKRKIPHKLKNRETYHNFMTNQANGWKNRTNEKTDIHQMNFTIPLNLNITVGAPISNQLNLAYSTVGNKDRLSSTEADDTEDFFIEGTPEDYNDRDGYKEFFLSSDKLVLLPQVIAPHFKDDVLFYNNSGNKDCVLRYRHFSVVMSKGRRQCFFSAVNIDGRTSVSSQRGPWRIDPRIPHQAQIMKECYGNPPKFSRGHMTRREDPVWGSPQHAQQGNLDSMHVTNAVPQMQSHNGGVWLKLEDYALKNARKDKMRISVFTGPVFKYSDPEMYGVKIPVEFWKVIAFIHDQTGELCATGYTISQQNDLQEDEFVFGAHYTYQKSLKEIEDLTGISFGDLTEHDPLATSEETHNGPLLRPLSNMNDIKYI